MSLVPLALNNIKKSVVRRGKGSKVVGSSVVQERITNKDHYVMELKMVAPIAVMPDSANFRVG